MIVNNSTNNGANWCNGFMDAINILSFMIGLKNLDLNVTAQDLSKESNRILEQLHAHFVAEDEHLTLQDKHLIEQNRRLDKLEKIVLGMSALHGRKENKNG